MINITVVYFVFRLSFIQQSHVFKESKTLEVHVQRPCPRYGPDQLYDPAILPVNATGPH